MGSERIERVKTEENVFQLLKGMVNDAKQEIETERKDRIQSEETMLQLLEQTCSQIALQRAKETGQDVNQMLLQKINGIHNL